MGVDLRRLLDRAQAMAAACAPDVPARREPRPLAGRRAGRAGQAGRDKVTFVAAAGARRVRPPGPSS